jgi:hypothetical protein
VSDDDRWAVERALRDSGLPPNARHVARTLLFRAESGTAEVPAKFAPSLSALAHDTGLAQSTVKVALNALETADWLIRDRDIARALAEKLPTGYRLRIPTRPVTGPVNKATRPVTGLALGRSPARTRPVTGHRPEHSRTTPEHSFEEFWKIYPRQERKQAAAKAWRAALADGEDPAVLIDSATRFARRVDGTEQRYIVYPARWLGERHWCDTLTDEVKVDLPRKIIKE